MPSEPSDLLDVNVWLALMDVNHVHHERARRYWQEESRPSVGFCRVSMLGLLRLATNPTVMRGQAFTPEEAWRAYRQFRALPEVLFLHEPAELETQMAAWSERSDFPARRWTDCYLAALASVSACRLVSFDRDYLQFPGLDFFHLTP